MSTITPAMKVIMAGAGIGLAGGVVAERLASPRFMDQARTSDAWKTLHDDFLKDNPVPAGTSVWVESQPRWQGAALVATGGIALAGAGIGAYQLATRMSGGAGNFKLGVAGVTLAAAGAAALVGSLGSWMVR